MTDRLSWRVVLTSVNLCGTLLQVWNVKTFACIATLKGHNHWVRALCVSGGVLYSGCHNLIKARTRTFSPARLTRLALTQVTRACRYGT
jgi:WD40 repeat protein